MPFGGSACSQPSTHSRYARSMSRAYVSSTTDRMCSASAPSRTGQSASTRRSRFARSDSSDSCSRPARGTRACVRQQLGRFVRNCPARRAGDMPGRYNDDMRYRVLWFITGTLIAALAVCGCDEHPRRTPDPNGAPRQTRLRLRCEPRSSLLQCVALASSDATTGFSDSRDVTDAVRWSSSDDGAVVVDGGRIRVQRGGAAEVTATWIEIPGAPSASVMVMADPRGGDARQAYVLEGEVRRFPSAEGVADAKVSLMDESGRALTVITSGRGDGTFRFAPLASGRYRLHAVHEGYRSTNMTIEVPNDMPHTITLLPEASTSAK